MSKVMKCPHCLAERVVPRGSKKAKCLKCNVRIRLDSKTLVPQKTVSHAKKLKRFSVLNGIKVAGIKGDQVPNSMYEASFKKRCAEIGWKVHRPSWPDFIVETESEIIGVEVKGGSDEVSATQRATFDVLERMGMKIYVWRSGKSTLTRWERYKAAEARKKITKRRNQKLRRGANWLKTL